MIKFLTLPAIVTTVAISSCSQAQEAPIPDMAAKTVVKAANWDVIAAESHVKFTATQQGESFTGAFTRFEADINFDPGALDKASVRAVIDLSSIQAGDKDRDGALPGKEWFHIKKFPEAVFESTDFTALSEDKYEARGTLSMKGVSKPLTLPFKLTITDGKADMSGHITLDRTLWDVGSGAWATDEWVSTDVELEVIIKAEQ